MDTNRPLKTGAIVTFADDEDEAIYLLGNASVGYINQNGAITSGTRPPDERDLVPLVVVKDEGDFIEKVFSWSSIPMDMVVREKVRQAIRSTFQAMRESYYEPSLAEKMYNESPRKSSSWVPWEKLDDAEAAGWKKAAEMKEAYDKLLESGGMKMVDVSPPVKGPDYNVGGVLKRPIKDVPQA